jgi:hypothetical protein
MIVTLGANDASRVLRVVAEGAVDFAEIRAHLLDERADGALGYRELIDARRAEPAMSAADVRRVVDLVRREARALPLGPTAVVVSSNVAYGMLRMLETLVEDVAAIRPFRNYRKAVRWLASARGTQRGAGSLGTDGLKRRLCARCARPMAPEAPTETRRRAARRPRHLQKAMQRRGRRYA